MLLVYHSEAEILEDYVGLKQGMRAGEDLDLAAFPLRKRPESDQTSSFLLGGLSDVHFLR